MGFRQVKEFTGALSPGKPRQPTAANGHQGLGHLVPAALGVLPGIQPEKDTGPAVGRHHGQGADQYAQPSQRQNLHFGDSCQYIHAQHQRKHNGSGSHIRLQENQGCKHSGKKQRLIRRIP